MIRTDRVTVETRGEYEMHDLTRHVASSIGASGCEDGIVTVFVAHTTAAVMMSEHEPGLLQDVRLPMQRMAPADLGYLHNQLNADDNAHSHLLASILGPSLTVPFEHGRLVLGTWQSIALIELDTHPRRRDVVIHVMGE
jgi:secondary thiamine-phosphate synthase enzyme